MSLDGGINDGMEEEAEGTPSVFHLSNFCEVLIHFHTMLNSPLCCTPCAFYQFATQLIICGGESICPTGIHSLDSFRQPMNPLS